MTTDASIVYRLDRLGVGRGLPIGIGALSWCGLTFCGYLDCNLMPSPRSHQLPRRNPLSCLRHIPGQPVTYLQNHKAASNSIELALWRAHDPHGVPADPHVPERPFIKNMRRATETEIQSLLASEFFSVVRNPYSRFLAAYLDKVGVGKRSWTRISGSLGLAPDFHPSLAELLSALQDSNPYEVEKHFRPQHMVLLHGLAPLDFLGHMERLDRLSEFLRGHGLELQRYDRHATHAAARVREVIRPYEARIIARYYEADFQIYGYSENPAELFPLERPSPTQADRMPLRRFIEQMTTKMRERSNGQAHPERDSE